MHKFPKWVHHINDTVIPVLGYLFIIIGILQWGIHLIPIGIGLLALYWLSQIASWLAYLNRRFDKYFAPQPEIQRQNLEYMFSRFSSMMSGDKPSGAKEEKPKVESIDKLETIKEIKEIRHKGKSLA